MNDELYADLLIRRSTDLVSQYFFIAGYIIWSVYSVLFLTTIVSDPAHTFMPIRLAGLVLMLASVVLKRNIRVNALALIVTILALVFFAGDTYIFAQHAVPIESAFIIIAALGVSFDLLLKYLIPVKAFVIAVIIFASRLGIISDQITGGSRTRHYLGFEWTSYASYLFLFVIILCIAYYKDRIKWWAVIAIILFNQYLYMLTNTKTPYLIVLISLLGWVALSKSSYIRLLVSRCSKAIIVALLPLLTLLNMFLSETQHGSTKLDNLVSGRFTLGHEALTKFGMSLFGHNIKSVVSPDNPLQTYFTIDSGLLRLLLNFGIIAFILYYIGLLIVQYRLLKTSSYFTLFAIWIVILTGFTDPWMLFVDFNVFLLLVMNAGTLRSKDFKALSGSNASDFAVLNKNIS